MLHTPCFPAWRARLAASPRSPKLVRQVRAYTLCQLENACAQWVPATLFGKAAHGRDRIYTQVRTFWCMVWQALNPATSGREVVRQLQALFQLAEGPALSEEDGAYCRAKARLPAGEFLVGVAATARAADRLAAPATHLQGRPVKAVDGSALTLADTPENRRAYPALQCPDSPSFPMLRFVVFCSLLSGAVLAVAQGSLRVSELALLGSLASQLVKGDILLGDRAYGCYPAVAWLQSLGVDFIGRTTRRCDGRCRTGRLAKNDWLIVWKKGALPSAWLSAAQWAGVPAQMTLRVVKGSCWQKGFRVRQVTLVTTLVDPKAYPASEILRSFVRRWRLEMCLDDLKTTLQMETLRGRSPAMVQKELYTRLLAHNLVRCLALEAAAAHAVDLEHLSFKGALDALRHFAHALARARSGKKRRQIWTDLLATLAADLVPPRPGRREPRALKRQKNKYPRLNVSRRRFRDHPKRNLRRKNARLRNLGLM